MTVRYHPSLATHKFLVPAGGRGYGGRLGSAGTGKHAWDRCPSANDPFLSILPSPLRTVGRNPDEADDIGSSCIGFIGGLGNYLTLHRGRWKLTLG